MSDGPFEEAQIEIMKLTVAQRQLEGAIRLYFGDEDPVLVVALAFNSLGILRDRLRSRGKLFYSTKLHQGLIGIARRLAKRDEQALKALSLFSGTPALNFILDTASKIEQIGLDAPIEQLMEMAPLDISSSNERAIHDQFAKVPNFLKHADRDGEASIKENELRPVTLIAASASAYDEVMSPNCISPELLVFTASLGLLGDSDWLIGPPSFHEGSEESVIQSRLVDVPENHRKQCCLNIIAKIKLLRESGPNA